MSRARKIPLAPQASERARKAAAGVLQVMAGLKAPGEVSAALGVSLNRYYQLERRGLEGLARAMEPAPRGRRVRPEVEVERLRREKAKAEREASRYQALLRASQKALGFSAVSVPRRDSRGRRARRPRVRAEALVRELGGGPEATETVPATT